MERASAVDIIDKLWRRKTWILAPLLLGISLAYLAVKRIEPLYQARAILYVEEQKIPKSFVADTVTTDVSDRLRQIEQQVKQDEILEQIVLKLNLYPTLMQQGRTNDAVRAARRSIGVRLDPRSRTLQITFSGPDRTQVAPAANLIANLVIEKNASLRAQQSRGTTVFVESQIADALEQRQVLAEEMARKRREWDGSLPEQRQSHRRAIEERERRLNAIEADIDNAETRRTLLQRADGALRQAPARTAAGVSQEEELKTQLRRLRSQYTDRHPDVIRLQQEIAALEPAGESVPAQGGISPQETSVHTDPILNAELQAVDLELDRLRADRSRITNEIAGYRRKLEVVPVFEEELASLERQYKIIDSLYSELLKERIEAELAERLQTQGQSQQLSIMKRASTPSKPHSPKVSMWLVVGLGIGGALGLGLAFLRDELDRTFTNPDALSEAFPGVTLLSVIPNLDERVPRSTAGKGKRRRSA